MIPALYRFASQMQSAAWDKRCPQWLATLAFRVAERVDHGPWPWPIRIPYLAVFRYRAWRGRRMLRRIRGF